MIDVRISGIAEAEAKLDPEIIWGEFNAGIAIAQRALIDAVREQISDHRYTGRFERSLQANVSDGGLGGTTVAEVGVDSSQVPEAGPLVFGWRSHSGRQPPTGPIARWLASRGLDSSAAYVVARAIGRRGYSFPPTAAFARAAAEVPVADIVAEAIGAR